MNGNGTYHCARCGRAEGTPHAPECLSIAAEGPLVNDLTCDDCGQKTYRHAPDCPTVLAFHRPRRRLTWWRRVLLWLARR